MEIVAQARLDTRIQFPPVRGRLLARACSYFPPTGGD